MDISKMKNGLDKGEKMAELKKETSCGCIITKNNKVLLVYEKRGNFWGFPKGHMEEGETEIETALREVKEEVGIDVKINPEKRYPINYIIGNEIDKTTVLYLATPITEDVVMQEAEIENFKWCSYEEALETLKFDNLKELFKEVMKEL